MATLESIQAKLQKLQRQAESLIAKQASGVIEKIRKLMAEHGLTTADISTQIGGKRPSTKFAGKGSEQEQRCYSQVSRPENRSNVDRTRPRAELDCNCKEPRQVPD